MVGDCIRFDATQQVAKDYGAACTPDFFVFDGARGLAYRGRMDETRPDRGEPTGADLAAALDALLDGRSIEGEQFAPMGCSIKWAPGNEPASSATRRRSAALIGPNRGFVAVTSVCKMASWSATRGVWL